MPHQFQCHSNRLFGLLLPNAYEKQEIVQEYGETESLHMNVPLIHPT